MRVRVTIPIPMPGQRQTAAVCSSFEHRSGFFCVYFRQKHRSWTVMSRTANPCNCLPLGHVTARACAHSEPGEQRMPAAPNAVALCAQSDTKSQIRGALRLTAGVCVCAILDTPSRCGAAFDAFAQERGARACVSESFSRYAARVAHGCSSAQPDSPRVDEVSPCDARQGRASSHLKAAQRQTRQEFWP